MVTLRDFDPYTLYLNWINGCDNFECFFKSTPFVCLKNYPDFILEEQQISYEDENIYNKCSIIINKHNRFDSLFILDINGEQIIKIAYMFQNELYIKPILTFNAILHPYGLIQGKNFISNLVLYGNLLEKVNLDGFIFILDKNRYISNSDGTEEDFFNNQYETTEEDLPNIDFIKKLNYKNLIYIYKDTIKEDINCYLDYLEHFDIKVFRYKIGDYDNG